MTSTSSTKRLRIPAVATALAVLAMLAIVSACNLLIPGVPRAVTTTAGDRSAVVSWNPPAFNSTPAPTGYVVGYDGGPEVVFDSTTTQQTISGLTDGTFYSFWVRAFNDAGRGPAMYAPPVQPVELATFYLPPDPLPAGTHGDLIRSHALAGSPSLPSAAANYLVLYHSTSVDGRDIAVSGTVAIPRGSPPAGGWPVLSWGHGATGSADFCAPSLDSGTTYLQHDLHSAVLPSLDAWVARGYVVAQTDYEGLGTPGPHPYMVGQSEGRSMVDIVRAARQLDSTVGARWVAVGHSVGGQAALFAAELAGQWAPELTLVGVAALSPSSHRTLALVQMSSGSSVPMAFTDFPEILAGAEATDPTVPPPEQLLTPTGLDAFRVIDTTCATGIDNLWKVIPANQVLQSGIDTAPLAALLQATEPGQLRIPVPILITESSDTVKNPNFTLTNFLVGDLTSLGNTVLYKTYPGLTHEEVIAGSLTDTEQWVDARFAEHPA